VNEGQKGTIPRGQGGGWSTNSIQWRKRNLMAIGSSATALTEGVPPNFSDVTWTTVTTQLAQYGAALKHSDLIAHAGIDDNVAQFAEALGELAGLVVNTLVVNELAAGGTVQLGTKASASAARINISAGDTLDNIEIKKAVRTLELAYVPKYPDGMYHGFVHVRQAYDLRADTVWQALNGTSYHGQGGLQNGSLGTLHGVKLETSTVTPIYTGLGESSADVYGAFIMGPDSFGVRDFAAWKVPNIDKATGKGVRVMFVPADKPTKDDPLGQFGTMGYKFAFVAKILDGTRFVRLETQVA
jgi:N4-gp56 family major capsid protein